MGRGPDRSPPAGPARLAGLSGRKGAVGQGEEGRYRYVESRSGGFSRTFELPRNVKADAIEAGYKDGVLQLRVPKADEAKPKTIEIK